MTCPKCNSNNVLSNVVVEQELVKKHHSFIWWILIGWWWLLVKWIGFFWIALICKMFGIGGKRQIKNTQVVVHICQNCGNKF